MEFSTSAFRSVAWVCYPIGLLLCLAPLGDLIASVGTLNPGVVPWRFGAAGLLSSALVLPMLGLGLFFAGAVVLEHRGVVRVLSVVCGLLLIGVGALLVVFVLDSFQVRAQVRPDAKRAFDLAAYKAGLSFLMQMIVLLVLTVNLHRAARRIAHRLRRTDGAPLVVPTGEP